MISFRVSDHAEAKMRGERASIEVRFGELLTGAVERILPLLDFQGLQEELNREPEKIEGESWRRWEKRLLTRLLFRMAEAVALQQGDFDSKSKGKTGDQHEGLGRKVVLQEHRGLKRVAESSEKEENKRQKKDHDGHVLEVGTEVDPVSPSLLPDHGSQDLDAEDQELVEVLAQMAEEGREPSSTTTPLVSSNTGPGGEVNTDMASSLNELSDKNTGGLGSSVDVSKNHDGASDLIKDATVRLVQTVPPLTRTPYPINDARVSHPPYVQRASSTPAMTAQTDTGRGNRTLSNVTTPLSRTSPSPGSMSLPFRTPSMPAPTSEPWWASRKVKLKSKTSTHSTPMPRHPEAEKSTVGAETLETRSEIVQGEVGKGFETGKNGEKIAEEDGTGNESGECPKKEGEDEGSKTKGKNGKTVAGEEEEEVGSGKEGSNWETGGKGGKSRAARRAEKRKLRREETEGSA